MDDERGPEVAALIAAISELSERVNVLSANLRGPGPTPPAGGDVDAALARASRLATLRAADGKRRTGT
jgi:hypothetical protein